MASETPKRGLKKTDTVEVRVDPAMKAALRAEAQAAGVTVSEHVRGVLSRHLADPATARARPRTAIAKSVMTTATRRPLATILGLAATSLVAGLTVSAPGAADDVALDVSLAMERVEGEMRNTWSFETNVLADYDTPVLLSFPSRDEAAEGAERFEVSMTAKPHEVNGEPGVVVAFQIDRHADGDVVTLATPSITMAFDEAARMEISAGDQHVEFSRLALDVRGKAVRSE